MNDAILSAALVLTVAVATVGLIVQDAANERLSLINDNLISQLETCQVNR